MTTITLTSPAVGDTTAMRHAMASSQLRTTGVHDNRVVAAMATVPRESFLPPDARGIAYRDTAVPLGGGRYQNPPMPTGRLLTEAALIRGDRVLLIGAAGGYTAAVLAFMGMVVTAVEEDTTLLSLARAALADEPQVVLVEGALTTGAPEHAPFDVLVIDGAVEQVPAALVEQVRPEGRIVAGLSERGVSRLVAGRRSQHGAGLVAFADAACAPLPGFDVPRGFTF